LFTTKYISFWHQHFQPPSLTIFKDEKAKFKAALRNT
jgi:hypothetical protein